MAAMTAWATELAAAVELAEAAGVVVRESYGRVEQIAYKSRRDVVTEVDFRSEALLVDSLQARFPTDAILSEEAGNLPGAEDARRSWVIDPLDGTVNYANGIPYFCVSVALVVDGRPAVGAVHDPLRLETYAATADGPATLNGGPVSASTKAALSDCVVSLAILGSGGLEAERAVAAAIRIQRRMGSAALSLAAVAAGRFDGFIQNGGLSRWDVAAAALIAERGGARVTDLAGGDWWDDQATGASLSVVAAPEPHHGELLGLLHSAGAQAVRRP
jgi:myo-inositol-1(or 4)-monophosphatase